MPSRRSLQPTSPLPSSLLHLVWHRIRNVSHYYGPHHIRFRILSGNLLKLKTTPYWATRHLLHHRRIIRWAGYVSRMPMSRAPMKFLTGWVANSRPIGCPQIPNDLRPNVLKKHFLQRLFVWIKWRELSTLIKISGVLSAGLPRAIF